MEGFSKEKEHGFSIPQAETGESLEDSSVNKLEDPLVQQINSTLERYRALVEGDQPKEIRELKNIYYKTSELIHAAIGRGIDMKKALDEWWELSTLVTRREAKRREQRGSEHPDWHLKGWSEV